MNDGFELIQNALEVDPGQLEAAKSQANNEGPLMIVYANFVCQICEKIRQLVGTEENVNTVNSEPDLENWKLELASFLRELQCPYDFLMLGDSDKRLESANDRSALIFFLSSELIAARKVAQMSSTNRTNSSNLSSLNGILHCLRLDTPPPNIPTQALFKKLVERVHGMPANLKSLVMCEPLMEGLILNDNQWRALSEVSFIGLALIFIQILTSNLACFRLL